MENSRITLTGRLSKLKLMDLPWRARRVYALASIRTSDEQFRFGIALPTRHSPPEYAELG
jgi:hypothetical protein